MTEHPTLARLEALARKKSPPPSGLNIPLSPDAIHAVGYIVLQWAALYERVLASINYLRCSPYVSEELRWRKPDLRQESNIRYLGDLGAVVYATERTGAAELFQRNIAHIFSFKADRDKLAHGTFALLPNAPSDGIVGEYKGRQFHLSAKRIRAVAEGISRCTGFLMEFDFWVHAERHGTELRSLLETPEQQGHPHSIHVISNLRTLPPRRESSQG